MNSIVCIKKNFKVIDGEEILLSLDVQSEMVNF